MGPGQGPHGRQPRTRSNTGNFGDSEKAQPTLHSEVRAPAGFAFRRLTELTSFRSPWLWPEVPQPTKLSSSLKNQPFFLFFFLNRAWPVTAAQAPLCFRVAHSDQSNESPEAQSITLTCDRTGHKAARAVQAGRHGQWETPQSPVLDEARSGSWLLPEPLTHAGSAAPAEQHQHHTRAVAAGNTGGADRHKQTEMTQKAQQCRSGQHAAFQHGETRSRSLAAARRLPALPTRPEEQCGFEKRSNTQTPSDRVDQLRVLGQGVSICWFGSSSGL